MADRNPKSKIIDADFEVIRPPDGPDEPLKLPRQPFWRRPIPLPFGLRLAYEPPVQWALVALIVLIPLAAWVNHLAGLDKPYYEPPVALGSSHDQRR